MIILAMNKTDSVIASALLLKKYPDAQLHVTSARRIAELLETLAAQAPARVTVAGVGFYDDSAPRVKRHLDALHKTGARIDWYMDEPHLDKHRKTLLKNVRYACGSGESLPRLVAHENDIRDQDANEFLALYEKGAGKQFEFIGDLIQAAFNDYFVLEDDAAVPNVIRRLTPPYEPSAEDRMQVARYQTHGSRRLTGKSQAIADLRNSIKRIGLDSLCRVMILGESGTGKETAARMIHLTSNRKNHAFHAVNCGNFSHNLLVSELFGHEKGAFTGADMQRKGAFELADGGTLFLDEVGELPLDLQPRLLRVLEEKAFRRLGGNELLRVDVRVVAATNKDLAHEVEEGRFREDLYYRLNEVTICTPPLRERLEDLGAVANEILFDICKKRADIYKQYKLKPPPRRLAPEQIAALCKHSWPGNVRELHNVLLRAVVMDSWNWEELIGPAPRQKAGFDARSIRPLKEFENDYVRYVYEMNGYNKTKTADTLGISITTLRAKLKEAMADRPQPGA
jgi:DNA-binding NtrC family response regulator